MITAATPIKYVEGATHAPAQIECRNKAAVIKAMIGSLAPQGINVVVMMVILRSRWLSIVREAMIPGTPHPEPTSIGMKDLPERPNLLKILSSTKATRARYPQDSRNASKKNKTSIWGTKPNTAPTPPMMPSITRPVTNSFAPALSSHPDTRSGILGTNTAPSVSSIPGASNSPSSSSAPASTRGASISYPFSINSSA